MAKSKVKKPDAAEAPPQAEASPAVEKSVQAFRNALEHSVTVSRERLQDVVDDAVKRGRMTRRDAEELVSRLVTDARSQTDGLLNDLEQLVARARRETRKATKPVRKRTTAAAQRAQRQLEGARDTAASRVRKVTDEPLAQADRLRRQAGIGKFPITAYDHLNARQIIARLPDLSKDQLRKVRDYESTNRGRKGILGAVDRKLG
jgi:polyhydroxyalkanoate synthesis regulator phasin